jgi:hypothetical protein
VRKPRVIPTRKKEKEEDEGKERKKEGRKGRGARPKLNKYHMKALIVKRKPRFARQYPVSYICNKT